jgi:hypothetical protein
MIFSLKGLPFWLSQMTLPAGVSVFYAMNSRFVFLVSILFSAILAAGEDPELPSFELILDEYFDADGWNGYSTKISCKFVLSDVWYWGNGIFQNERYRSLSPKELLVKKNTILQLNPGESLQFVRSSIQGSGTGWLGDIRKTFSRTKSLDEPCALFVRTETGGVLWIDPPYVDDDGEGLLHSFPTGRILQFDLSEADLDQCVIHDESIRTDESYPDMGVKFTSTLKGNFSGKAGKIRIKPFSSYTKWLPSPGLQGKPERITVEVEMLPKSSNHPAQEDQIDLFLKRVSREPGVCGNFPYAEADLSLDITFADDTPGITVDPNDPTHAWSNEKIRTGKPLTIVLEVWDYAASGRLEVKGRNLDFEGIYEPTKEKFLHLPYDRNQNTIADAWEQKEGVFAMDAESDEDLEPDNGSNKHGDGLTIFEEYRGFSVGGKHIRTNPKVKDFFVANTIGHRAVDGIALLQSVTGLKVHGKLTLEELGASRIINRNACYYHVVDQHGVKIVNAPVDQKYSIARGSGPGTPKTADQVEISSFDQWTLTNFGSTTSKIQTNLLANIVAHELLHCLNVIHHGESDGGYVKWYRKTFRDGAVFIVERDCGWDAVDDPASASLPVDVKLENGRELDPHAPSFQEGVFVWLGTKSGQHSGVEDCLMRYDVASAYESDIPGLRYYLKDEKEMPGIYLCDSTEPTGVNALDRKPESRYGAPSKGNCAAQVCVNDKY